jgi:hypothetical protein
MCSLLKEYLYMCSLLKDVLPIYVFFTEGRVAYICVLY